MSRKWVMWRRSLLTTGVGICLPYLYLQAADPAKEKAAAAAEKAAQIQLVQKTPATPQPPMPQPPMPQPPMPEQPPLPDTTPTAPEPGGIGGARPPRSPLGNTGGAAPDSSTAPDRAAAVGGGAPSSVVTGSEAVGRAASDAGDLLGRSTGAGGIGTQRRSPIATEARIRGLRLAEITTHADGAFWFPARLDLDTFLSKIDSGIIDDIIVLRGPYSARYGPGLSFIDIATERTPRYQNGFEWHGRTFATYKINGEQFYARQAIWGGGEDWGFRGSYGHRIGNDYNTGAGVSIPSSYNARDVDLVFGYDFSPVSRLEIGYMRLDQTGLEFPGQIFDTNFLVTDGLRLRYILEKQQYFDRLTFDTWYNYTRLAGDAQGAGKRTQIPILNTAQFNGFTDIDLGSLGYRLATTWGEAKHAQLTVGTDFRRLNGHLNEFDTLAGLNVPCGNTVNSPIPRSHQGVVGGAFVEYVYPYQDYLVVKMGARGDWVSTDIQGIPPGFTCATFNQTLDSQTGPTDDYDRQFGLWLSYLTAEYKLNQHWTVVGGLGHAERPPTTAELYALQPFLAILQQGFTSVQGNARLNPERLWQLDLGLRAEYDSFRAGFSTFAMLIQDYITYQALGQSQKGVGFSVFGSDALLVQFVNTELASLAGFELYGEFDYNEYVTPFLTMSYVEGRDHSRARRGTTVLGPGVGGLGSNQEPLGGIPPFETRTGVRLHEARRAPRWGLELATRLVASQDRVASSLNERRSSGFAIYDVRSFWQARQGLLLTAGVENVFDRNYREHLDLRTGRGVFQPGVNGYFGVEMRY